MPTVVVADVGRVDADKSGDSRSWIGAATGKALHRMLFGAMDTGGDTSEESEGLSEADFEEDLSDLDPEERMLQKAIMRNFMQREKKKTIEELTFNRILAADDDKPIRFSMVKR